MAFSKFFYPRISYGGTPTLIDFADPVTWLQVVEPEVRLANLSAGGVVEALTVRSDYFVTLRFDFLEATTLAALRTWWRDHARLMKQSALTLDRLGTCGGQYEYDVHNATFSKAELQNNPFQPSRSILSRARYTLELVFRQGT